MEFALANVTIYFLFYTFGLKFALALLVTLIVTRKLFLMETLTSVPDYWKSNSFDYMDLYWQNGVSALSYAKVL